MLKGLETLEEQLLRSVRTGRFPHAHIFEGPFGCGKKTLVDGLCRALNCTGEHPPCRIRRRFTRRCAPQQRSGLAAPLPKRAREVETIRDLIEKVSVRTFDGRMTVVIEAADHPTA